MGLGDVHKPFVHLGIKMTLIECSLCSITNSTCYLRLGEPITGGGGVGEDLGLGLTKQTTTTGCLWSNYCERLLGARVAI